jgi:hypothetical protein
MILVKLLALLPLLIGLLQMYNYAVTKSGVERQKNCRGFGITCITVGIVSLVFRSVPLTVAGLILIMMGLRLVAHGLDRLDKTVYIDRYQETPVPSAAVAAPQQAAAACSKSAVEDSGNGAICSVPESSLS